MNKDDYEVAQMAGGCEMAALRRQSMRGEDVPEWRDPDDVLPFTPPGKKRMADTQTIIYRGKRYPSLEAACAAKAASEANARKW